MVSSSEKDSSQTGPSLDTGLGLYTPSDPQASGTDQNMTHHETGFIFAPSTFYCPHAPFIVINVDDSLFRYVHTLHLMHIASLIIGVKIH